MNKILYHPKPGTTGFFYGDFPEERSAGYCKLFEFTERVRLAKEEAIKNGEIVNIKLLPVQWVATDTTSYFYKGSLLKDGDTFPVPDGIEFNEEEEYYTNGWAEGTQKVIRLSKKEEDEADVMVDFLTKAYLLILHHDRVRMLLEDFTIQRKQK